MQTGNLSAAHWSNSMTDSLSPAAQTVLDAYGSSPLLNDHVLDHRHCLAAALRAVVALTQLYQGNDCLNNECWMCDADELLAIAAELESAND